MTDKEAINKQKTKEAIVEPYFYGEEYYCPYCGKYIGSDCNDLKGINYCDRCGQKIAIKKY